MEDTPRKPTTLERSLDVPKIRTSLEKIEKHKENLDIVEMLEALADPNTTRETFMEKFKTDDPEVLNIFGELFPAFDEFGQKQIDLDFLKGPANKVAMARRQLHAAYERLEKATSDAVNRIQKKAMTLTRKVDRGTQRRRQMLQTQNVQKINFFGDNYLERKNALEFSSKGVFIRSSIRLATIREPITFNSHNVIATVENRLLDHASNILDHSSSFQFMGFPKTVRNLLVQGFYVSPDGDVCRYITRCEGPKLVTYGPTVVQKATLGELTPKENELVVVIDLMYEFKTNRTNVDADIETLLTVKDLPIYRGLPVMDEKLEEELSDHAEEEDNDRQDLLMHQIAAEF